MSHYFKLTAGLLGLALTTAMAQAGIPYVYQSVYDLTYTCLKKLLNVKGD